MKTLRNLLTAVVILCGTLTMNAQSMSITAMRSNARFLTDRMAYTLGIRDPYLIDEIYRINYDYIYGVNVYLDDIALGYYYDDYMLVCNARDAALRNLLGITIWNRLLGYSYFHRPIIFDNHRWHFGIYDHDRYGAHYFHYAPPRPFGNGYSGGHFFGGMAPRGGRGNAAPPPPPAPNRGNAAPTPPRNDGNNGRGNAAPTPPRNDGNNGRGNAAPTPPQNDGNNGRGNAAPTPPRGDSNSVGGRSQSNMQSSSRVNSAPETSRTRSNDSMNSSRSNAGRNNTGTARSNSGASRGGGRR